MRVGDRREEGFVVGAGAFEVTAALTELAAGGQRAAFASTDLLTAHLRRALLEPLTAAIATLWAPGAHTALDAHLSTIDAARRDEEAAWGRFWLGLDAQPGDERFVPR